MKREEGTARLLLAFACLVVLLLGGAGGALAQGGAPNAAPRFAVIPEPGTTVVATEVLIATPTGEENGQPGIAYLAGRAVTEPVIARLDSLGADLNVRVGKDAVSFSLVAAPDAWEEASRILLLALFRDPVDSLAIERERRAIRAELAGRAANPLDVLARTTDAAAFGPEHPWGRSEVGDANTIGRFRLADVDGFLRTYFLAERAVVAIVGPVEVESATAHLLPFFRGTEWTPPVAEPAAPLESPVRSRYNTITTWISASYPFSASADVEALRMLAELASETLAFGPHQRSIYDAQVQVLPRPGGGELRLQIAVPPGESDRWAGQLQQAVSQFADRRLTPDEFRTRLRSYQGRRLLELSSPEARAQEAARRLFLTGDAGPTLDLEDLNRTRLQLAAWSLGTPVLVLLGPFEEGEE